MEEPVADETQDLAEVRLEKLRQIEALGIDPWGHRFDNTTPIGDIRKLPAEPFDDAKPGPKVRAAGRVVRYRTGGKLYFLDIWDQTGRVQVMIRHQQGPRDRVEGRAAPRPRRPDRRRRRVRQDARPASRPSRPTKLTFLTKSLEPHPKDVFGMSDDGVPAAAPLPRPDLHPGHAPPGARSA